MGGSCSPIKRAIEDEINNFYSWGEGRKAIKELINNHLKEDE